MTLVFQNFHDGVASERLLNEAYEKACDALIDDHNIDPIKLRQMVGTISQAIQDLFNAGQRDETKLTRYAVSRALESLRGTRQHC